MRCCWATHDWWPRAGGAGPLLSARSAEKASFIPFIHEGLIHGQCIRFHKPVISPLPHAQLGSAAMGGARAGTAVGTAGAGNSLSRCDHCRRLWAAFLCFFDFSSAAAIFSAALATFFGSAFFFFFLQVCRCSTAMASSDMAGRTRWDSILKFSVLSSSLFGWILEVVEAVTTSSSTEPTPLLSGQSRKCSLVSGTPQVEQFGLSSNLNLCSFTLVGRRSWQNLKSQDLFSGERPGHR